MHFIKDRKISGESGANMLEQKMEFHDYDTVREDGRLERTCKHGVGHTVGHLDIRELKYQYIWVHGCDGCCKEYKRMGGPIGNL